jgi:DNA polymerase-3 subunit gamma/tau
VLGEAERELRWSSQPRLVLEMAAVKLCAPAAREPAPAQPAARTPQPRRSRPAPEETAFEPGEMTVQSICKGWNHIMERLKKKRHTALAAFLLEGTPVELKEGALTIEFNHEFHRDKMNSEGSKGALAEVVKEIWGQDVRVECRLAEKKAGPAPTLNNAMSVFPGSEVVPED